MQTAMTILFYVILFIFVFGLTPMVLIQTWRDIKDCKNDYYRKR
jgi:cytochrome bd-type quinol oxidase subunit 1